LQERAQSGERFADQEKCRAGRLSLDEQLIGIAFGNRARVGEQSRAALRSFRSRQIGGAAQDSNSRISAQMLAL